MRVSWPRVGIVVGVAGGLLALCMPFWSGAVEWGRFGVRIQRIESDKIPELDKKIENRITREEFQAVIHGLRQDMTGIQRNTELTRVDVQETNRLINQLMLQDRVNRR